MKERVMPGFESPLISLGISWVFLFGLYYSGIVTYHNIPESKAPVVFLALCLLFFLVGYLLTSTDDSGAEKNPAGSKYDSFRWAEDARRYKAMISIFAWMGILGAVLFAIEMLFFVRTDPTDLMGARELFLEREATIFSRIAVVIGAGGFFSLVGAILCWDYIRSRERFLWLLSPLALSLFSVLSAGRQTVLQLVLFTLIAFSLRRSTGAPKLRFKLAGVLFATLVVVYGMYASYERNSLRLEMSKKAFLLAMADADFHPVVDTELEKLPNVIRDGISETILYFSHEIPSFSVFWSLPRPELNWGLWELPFLARRLRSAGLVSYSVEERMSEIYDRFGESGRYHAVWQTVMRDLIIDFGETGALVFMGIAGFSARRIYRKFRTEGGLAPAFLLAGINLCCVYSIMLPAISDTLIFFYVLLSVILYVRESGSFVGLPIMNRA